MPTPQLPGFGDVSAFIRWKKSIDYRINLLFEKLNNVLANTGLSVPSPGVTQVDGTFNVLGTENVSGNLNVTGSATIGGATTISGATTVSGTNGIQSSNYVSGTSGWKFNGTSLEANTGVIGNGALANPVTPNIVNVRTTGFAIPIPYTEVASINLTVPAGCTRLLANVTAWVQGYNSKTTGGNNGAGGDYIYARVVIGSQQSAANTPTGVSGNGGTATASMGLGALLTGLTPGGTVHIAAQGGTDYGIAANATNEADFAGTLIWLK